MLGWFCLVVILIIFGNFVEGVFDYVIEWGNVSIGYVCVEILLVSVILKIF